MQPIPCPTTFRATLLVAVATAAPALTTELRAQVSAASAAAPGSGAGEAAKPDETNLPTFLLPVPGGKTRLGLTADELVAAVSQSINPRRPEEAAKSPDKVRVKLQNTSSALGPVHVDVEPFLLGKWAVTNKEYEVFVKKMRAIGNKVRPPFHWWRYGAQDHYNEQLEAINQAFPKEGAQGPVLYWERHGIDFPYALKDQNGKPIDDQPVVFVSYRDAVRFAGWLGMRLPSEAEMTRAIRGDSEIVWPWGARAEVGDRWTEDVLKELGLGAQRDWKLKPVGSVQFGTGPFGHFDMVGQVWELTATRGFGPLTDGFSTEWKRLQKDKLGSLLTQMPTPSSDKVVIKGASYLSAGDPIQFLVDSRVAIETIDVLESVGFRLAKSLKPGYDMLYSLINSEYEQGAYANDQAPDLSLQVGAERYVLGKDGFPEEYHAVTFAPANWLSPDKNATAKKLEEQSQTTPVVLGAFATTEKMATPDLAPGIYTIGYRSGGVPKELADAWKQGHKEVQAALKRKEKNKGKEDEEPAEDKKDDKDKKDSWRTVLARFGLGEKDLEPKDAEKPKIVRLDGLEVPIDQNVFLFRLGAGNPDTVGKWVGFAPTKAGLAQGNLAPGAMTFGSKKVGGADRATADFTIRTPIGNGNKRGSEFSFSVVLEQPPVPDGSWRLPQ